jgi:hypothetical protein
MKKLLKQTVLTLLLGCSLCFLAGCGKSELSESQLKKILPGEITSYTLDGSTHESTVSNFSIERRKTDKDTDEVQCAITLTDDYTERKVYAELNLTHYDKGGWQIDSWSTYKDGYCTPKVKPNNGDEEKAIAKLNFKNIQKDQENLDNGAGYYSTAYKVNDTHTYATFEGQVTYSAQLNYTEPSKGSPAKCTWSGKTSMGALKTTWNVLGTWSGKTAGNHPDRFEFTIKALESNKKVTGSGAYYYSAVVPGTSQYTGAEGSYAYHSSSYTSEGSSPSDAKLKVDVIYSYPSGTLTFTPDTVKIKIYGKDYTDFTFTKN